MDKIVVRGLWKEFDGTTAVADVSFTVGELEFFTLLGPSGCGKSTTLRCIAGLEEPTRGEISIGGRLVSAPASGIFWPPERRSVGMVFQNYAVWPHMTVFDNVAYPLRLQKLDRRTIEARVREVLDLVALRGLERRFPAQLSGGQQQRVALARALVRRPEVMLLDEPLSNLDAKLREQMRFELKELQRRMGVPILYVTHDQAEAMALSDRVAVMSRGQIVQVGAPLEIYRHPNDRFVADFMGLMNFLPGRVLARQGEQVVVEVLGQRIPIVDRSALVGPVMVAVRPEDLVMGQEGHMAGTVEVRNFMGSFIDYKVRVADRTLRVQTPNAQVYGEGERVALRVERALLFAAEAPA
ncbi:MAG: ABC transporter ATP-binding protein [Armatimonadota bacterium]|nr:ABC transporter ATP-binding protein [Armatimonadota bacterium]MDR7427008.1 ABC transporter ATP-binding protein [Armatimonadota bacterium]MDR7463074.1 ABC transporter ATP-binding protein [Armatimonadota bacterium]MDR7469343.1 ABC transporter ATP-binding protein [Armatimonadota bacterium]MDR7475598.1 ABC transporter ATP-binding protein [Armatimonadota bacterium]